MVPISKGDNRDTAEYQASADCVYCQIRSDKDRGDSEWRRDNYQHTREFF